MIFHLDAFYDLFHQIQLGCVSLEKEINSNNVVSRMFDEAIDLIGQQKTKMADLTLERDRLAKDKTAALEVS